MSKSKIQWTDYTWTPVRARVKSDAVAIATQKGFTSLVKILEARKPNGELRSPPGKVGPHCESVSHGCDHCYSENNNGRCLPANGTGLPFDRRSREFVTDEMIERVFAVMALCPQHTFQCLTKRPARMLKWFTATQPLSSREEFVMAQAAHTGKIVWDSRGSDRTAYFGCGKIGDVSNRRPWPGWPLPNVHLGVSVEDQPTADERIILLEQTPASVHFVSAEPLLAPIDFHFPAGSNPPEPPAGFSEWGEKRQSEWFTMQARATYMTRCGIPGQIIVGGESGPGARPCDVSWIRSIVRQCRAAGVACFVKQLGSVPVMEPCRQHHYDFGEEIGRKAVFTELGSKWRLHVSHKGGDPSEWAQDLRVRQMPEVRT